jgi:hypothetical protein
LSNIDLRYASVDLMRDEILNYIEMCGRENLSLQKGMNFFTPPRPSVVLMSQRIGSPYDDELSEDGTLLLYEGHDVRKTTGVDPKRVDQPWESSPGRPSENGRFAAAANAVDPPLVRVYEKLKPGIWTDRGLFELVGSDFVLKPTEGRRVFKFRLLVTEAESAASPFSFPSEHTRVIPSWVKQEVFKRDQGRCVLCGSTERLHFDHELPFSKGGVSVLPENIRILCAEHNLRKGARIE